MPSGIIRLDEGWHLDDSHHLDQPPFVPPIMPVLVARQKKGKAMDYIPSKRANQKQWWTKISTDINTEGPKMTLTAPDR